MVSLFAVIGRLSHAEGVTPAGWWRTAWPFLAGALLGWALVAALGRRGRAHREAPAGGGSFRDALVIWPSTVVVGMLLRRASDQGTAVAFVVVAFVVLGLMLVAPRVAVAWRRR